MGGRPTPRAWRAAALVVALSAFGACGKKGAPLAPIVRIPAAVEQMTARRVGHDVYVTLTVPAMNIDASTPADVGRVEVYGYTGRAAPPRARWAEMGTLVGTVPVMLPRRDGESVTPEPPSTGAAQGTQATIRDALTPDELIQGPADPTPPRTLGAARTAAQDLAGAGSSLRRFYMAIPVSPRGRPGPPGVATELPLAPIPDPPTGVAVSYREDRVSVAWEPTGGVLGFLLDRELPLEREPFDDVPLTSGLPSVPLSANGPTRYNVYREIGPDPVMLGDVAASVAPWNASPLAPINPAPVEALAFDDEVLFDREQCYHIRAVRGTSAAPVEGDPSPRVCVTPVDTFPPAPPSALAAVGAAGAISLVWEPNAEIDLAGYLVLRGEPGDATLQPLTPAPIPDARYRDTNVTIGKRYVYAVVAVDSRLPIGNTSAESLRAEDAAR